MYRHWQEDLARFQISKQGRRLANLNPESFALLWYVYNRGGVCNAFTLELWFGVSMRTCRARLQELVETGWLTALFKSSVYNKKDRLGKQPRMYRVSTRFLGCVGNPDAHIRKLKIKSKAVSSLGLTNFFLMPDQRTYQIINRRDRAAFLTNHCHISPDLFPKYFVQDQKAVVSLNHEIVCKENQVYVVWYPQSDFGGDFLSFIKKWGGVFKAGAKIQCLAITTNRPTQTLLAQFETERENPKETSKVATYHEEKARSRGIQPQKSNKKKIPCQLTTVHYPDVWQMYTEFGGRRT